MRVILPIQKGSFNLRLEFVGDSLKEGNIIIDNCEFDDIPVSFYESEKSSSIRVVSPSTKRDYYNLKFENFTQFNDFLRKRLGYEAK